MILFLGELYLSGDERTGEYVMWLDLSTKWRFIGDMWEVEILDIDPLYGDDDVRFGFLFEMRIGEARNGDGLYGDIFVGE